MTSMDKTLVEVFKEFDRDSKGYLNPRVMQKVLKHLGFNPSNKEIEQLIVDVDSSENGKIELDEFIEATKKLTCKKKDIQEVIRGQGLFENGAFSMIAQESFNTFDFMGRGFFKASDLKDSLMYIMTGAPEGEKANLIRHFNLDENRNIHFEEFSQILSLANTATEGECSFDQE